MLGSLCCQTLVSLSIITILGLVILYVGIKFGGIQITIHFCQRVRFGNLVTSLVVKDCQCIGYKWLQAQLQLLLTIKPSLTDSASLLSVAFWIM